MNAILAAAFCTRWSLEISLPGRPISKLLQESSFDKMNVCTSLSQLSRSKYFLILPILLMEKNANLHTLLTCLDNVRCESTSTPRSRAASVGDIYSITTKINTRKSNAMETRA